MITTINGKAAIVDQKGGECVDSLFELREDLISLMYEISCDGDMPDKLHSLANIIYLMGGKEDVSK